MQNHKMCINQSESYKYTPRLQNTDCLFATTMVAPLRPYVTYTYIACLVCLFFLSCNLLLLHLLRSLTRFPILLGKLSKVRYSSMKLTFFCNSASYFIPLSLKWNLRFRVTQSDGETFTWHVFVLITQYFLRHFSHDSIPEKSVMLSGRLVCWLTITRHNVCMEGDIRFPHTWYGHIKFLVKKLHQDYKFPI
jgi:hypothetical protein